MNPTGSLIDGPRLALAVKCGRRNQLGAGPSYRGAGPALFEHYVSLSCGRFSGFQAARRREEGSRACQGRFSRFALSRAPSAGARYRVIAVPLLAYARTMLAENQLRRSAAQILVYIALSRAARARDRPARARGPLSVCYNTQSRANLHAGLHSKDD